MKRTKIVNLIILCILLAPLTIYNVRSDEVPTFFSLSILSPNTSAARNQWAILIEDQFPLIGIHVTNHESTGWGNIGPRTWSYPFIEYDYIPTYAQGGYDVLFVGWNWKLDWNPTGLYDSASLCPYGDNFYQYINPTYDELLEDYLTETDPTTQLNYAYQMQEILLEDSPAAVLVYPKSRFGIKTGLTGIDPLLLGAGKDRYENWDDPDDHMITYAIPANLAEWNAYVQESFYDWLWMQGVYGKLYQRQAGSHTWTTEIADGFPTFTPDKMSFTVDINPNAKFSDGSTVLAEDVVYSLQLHMTPAVGSSSYSNYKKWFASNASVYAEDTDTVHFDLTDINPFVLELISFPIIDKSAIEPLISAHGYSIFNEVPGTGNVGWNLVKSCGPFKVSSYTSYSSTVVLVPNTYYSGTAPNLDQWILTYISSKSSAVSLLKAGSIDLIDSQFFLLADDLNATGVEELLVDDPSEQEMSFNLRNPYFGTGELTPVGTPEAAKYIRKAINHIIPRNQIVTDILLNLGSPGITSCAPSCTQFDPTLQPYAYNINTAFYYMELAGYDVPSYSLTNSETIIDLSSTETNAGTWFVSLLFLSLIAVSVQGFRKKRI